LAQGGDPRERIPTAQRNPNPQCRRFAAAAVAIPVSVSGTVLPDRTSVAWAAVSVSPPSLWRLLAKRTLAVWPLGLASFGAVLLAATLLATGPLYAEAAAQAGLERKLADADAEQAGLDVSGRVAPESYARTSARIEEQLRRALPALDHVHRVAESDSVAAADGRRYILGFVEEIAEHATLRSGRWPDASGDVPEAAISTAAAERTGLAVGDTVRLRGARTVTPGPVRIVGLYAVSDPEATLWWNDELALDGVRGRDTPTFGPLVVSERTLLGTAQRFRASWRARPEAGAFTVDGLQRSADSVSGLEERLREGVPSGVAPPVVATGLPELLDESRRELRVARSGVLVPLAQLALLAAYGLVFVAALIRRRRRREDELLLTRGANPRSLVFATTVEAALLAVLATLAAPWVAALAIEAVSAAGPLAAARLDLEPQVGASAYALAFAGALGCLAALVVPLLRDQKDATRGAQPGFFARTGLDVALLVAGGVALWQLRAEGSPVVEGEVDVLLVAVPAIGILAAAVLAGRLLPPVFGFLARVAAARPGAVAALATRRLTRTAAEHRPAAVLLVAAVAIGTFAAAYATTWDATQRERAALRVGADVLVPDDRRSDSYQPIGRANAFAATPGVASASPLTVDQLRVGDEPVRLVAVDAARSPAAPVGTDAERQRELLQELAGRRPDSGRPKIPAGATTLVLSARTTVEPLPDGVEAPTIVVFGAPHQVSVEPEPTLAVVVRDADGLLHRLNAGPLREGTTTLEVDLGPAPLHPLELAGLELAYRVPAFLNRSLAVELESPLFGDDEWTATTSPLAAPLQPAAARVTSREAGLLVRLVTGASELDRTGGTVALQPKPPEPRPLPVIAGTGLLAALGARVGNVIEVDEAAGTQRIEIVGALTNFATVAEGDRFLVADLATLQADRYGRSQEAARPDVWLLELENGRPAAALAALARPPLAVESASSREQLERSLTSDPLAVATSGALWLGFFAAALFATAAFAVAGAARSRKHLADASLLAGLGLGRRGTRAVLVLEDAILAVLAAAVGVGVGAALALLVLPAVAFTETGQAAVPPPTIVVPWGTVAALAGAVTGFILLAAFVRAAVASRASIAAELRVPAP
jgi:hypothetical protein